MAFVVRARSWNALAAACATASLLAISACTSNSSFPSASISTALTPQDSDLAAVAEANKANEGAEAGSEKAKPGALSAKASEPEQTQLALAPTATEAPSIEATDSVVKQTAATPTAKPVQGLKEENSQAKEKSKPGENTEAEGQTGQASAPKANTETDKQPRRKGLFASLFQSSPRTPTRDFGETRRSRPRKPAPRASGPLPANAVR